MFVLGRVYTIIAPTAGIQVATIVTRHRLLVQLAAIHEKKNAEIVDMIPVGMFKSEVVTASKPRLLMIIPLKVIKSIKSVSPYNREKKGKEKGHMLSFKKEKKERKQYQTSIWHIDSNVKQENNPRFRISNSLNSLLSFPRLVDNASLVLCQSRNGIEFLLIREEPGIHRSIRKIYHCHKRPRKGYRTSNYKQILPCWKSGRGRNVSHSPRQKPVNHWANRSKGNCIARRLLGFFIETSND